MSKSLEWLQRELSYKVPSPDVSQTMSLWREKILNSSEVVIFGAGGAGQRTKKVLEKNGVEVAFFLDNNESAACGDTPVYTPERAPKTNLTIVVASAWFVDIMHQLKQYKGKFVLTNVFPLPDVLQLNSEIYDDAAGYPFWQVLENRIEAFKRVANLYTGDSRTRFLKLLVYRLCFFQAYDLDRALLPCPAIEYERAEYAMQGINLPDRLGSEVKTLIRYQYVHPSYWQAGFMHPRDGDVIIDGGAWYGDTAYWFIRESGVHTHVYAFEPGRLAFSELKNTINKAELTRQITVVNSALSNVEGRASWAELGDASPCSHLSGDGDDVDVTSIDNFVSKFNIETLNMIKLDIEGADLKALQGASLVIARNRPDLAISVYHSAHHLVDIPLWIHQQDLGYKFYLSHNQLSISETVCLATCQRRP